MTINFKTKPKGTLRFTNSRTNEEFTVDVELHDAFSLETFLKSSAFCKVQDSSIEVFPRPYWIMIYQSESEGDK